MNATDYFVSEDEPRLDEALHLASVAIEKTGVSKTRDALRREYNISRIYVTRNETRLKSRFLSFIGKVDLYNRRGSSPHFSPDITLFKRVVRMRRIAIAINYLQLRWF